MRNVLEKPWTKWKAWLRAQSRMGRLSVWLTGIVLACVLLYAIHLARGLAIAIAIVCLLPLMPLSLILLYRWITGRAFWRVRNRLIATYLLMGLAPIVLFGTLSGIALYLFAGQYATNSTGTLLEQAAIEVSIETASAVTFGVGGTAAHAVPLRRVDGSGEPLLSIVLLKNGVWTPLSAGDASPFVNEGPPAWLHAPFHGLVVHGGKLYLCAEVNVQRSEGTTFVLGTRPLTSEALAHIAHGVGKITLFTNDSDYEKGFGAMAGGDLPQTAGTFDTPVFFAAPGAVLS